MKFAIGYPIWFKPDMLDWIITGIVEHINPLRAQLNFYFDGNDPESLASFEAHKHKLAGFNFVVQGATREIFENGCHRVFLDWFVNHTDAELLIVPQDDNRFMGSTILDDLENVMGQYGERLGYVGMRDGYNLRYASFVSSPWSGSDKTAGGGRIPVGTFQERMLMNPGPLCYPRHVVQRVGTIDPHYDGWYWWDDYAFKCWDAGFQNVLLSTDLLHEKHGKIKRSEIYQDLEGWVARDLAKLNARWGPRFGGNVI